MLFSTGDACDLQIASREAGGRCRYIITMYKEKPTVVRFQWDAKDAPKPRGIQVRSDRDARSRGGKTRPERGSAAASRDSYAIQLTLPWEMLQRLAAVGLEDSGGIGNLSPLVRRGPRQSFATWHTGAVGMVSDVPTEAARPPKLGAAHPEMKVGFVDFGAADLPPKKVPSSTTTASTAAVDPFGATMTANLDSRAIDCGAWVRRAEPMKLWAGVH